MSTLSNTHAPITHKPQVPHNEAQTHIAYLRKRSPRIRELGDMLSYCRPDNSDAEYEFIERYIETLPKVQRDGFGNYWVQVGKEAPTVAWSCHTDTVHHNEGRQALAINAEGLMALHNGSEANCLGADCTTGVWLMRRMVLAGKKGLYLFHRAEESGGKGSEYLLEHSPKLLSGIKAVIALDRRGYSSVITHQWMGRTASTRFARSLADQLPPGYRPDDTGTFTDSAVYADLVPECTNISVGYFDQHTHGEKQDIDFADRLLGFLIKLDYEKLVIERDPAEIDYSYDYSSTQYKGADFDGYGHNYSSTSDLASMVKRYPEAVALLLEQLGIDEADVWDAVLEMGGY